MAAFVSARCQANKGLSGPLLHFPHSFPHTVQHNLWMLLVTTPQTAKSSLTLMTIGG